MPQLMLLEDAEDVCDFLTATRRTIQPGHWAVEVIAASEAAALEGLF
jgi:hypothetical protein